MGRGRDIRRPTQTSPTGKRLIICCEGQGEEVYLDLIRQELRLPKQQAVITADCGTDPLSIVKEADTLRTKAQRNHAWRKGDTTWAVFDGDEHIQNDKEHWDQALDYARKKDIRVIISNPNLELWYLLHYQNQRRSLTKEQVKATLQRYVPDYDKKVIAIKQLYADLRSGQTDAIIRAAELTVQHERNAQVAHTNPSSEIYVLLEAMRGARSLKV